MRSVRDDRRYVNIRLDVARIFLIIGLLILVSSYWYLQFLRGGHYGALSEDNRLRSLPIPATRGVVLDRQGRVLTENEPAFNLLLFRREVKDFATTTRFLETALGLDAKEIAQRMARARGSREFVPVRLAEDLDIAAVARTQAFAPEHPELAIEITEKRKYKDSPRAAHILGYLGEVTPAQIKDNPTRFRPGDSVGLSGIEAVYNDHLAGRSGERTVMVDSLGREVTEAAKTPAVGGKSLPLTIDLRLQRIVEDFFETQTGSAVVLDPSNGEVLALASAPDFDPNHFVGRVSKSAWNEILSDSRHPLQNRAIQNLYSPGSTFKIVMAYAALERGIVSPSDQVYCPGAASFYGNTYRCHKAGGHGLCDLVRAVEVSCDVYFYTIGRRLGIDSIAEAARVFGLGSPTGIDLVPEKRGLVPSEEWADTVRKQHWYAGETISVAIGQGPLLVTPIQMARLVAAVANGGHLVTPHLVPFRKGERAAVPTIPMKRETLDLLRQSLWRVVNGESGTGSAARITGLDVCGKTGTVQVVQQKKQIKSEHLAWEIRDHAWFVAFAPKDNPKIALAIFVEHGGHGGTIAAPLAASLIRAHLLDQWPSPPASPAVPVSPEALTVAEANLSPFELTFRGRR